MICEECAYYFYDDDCEEYVCDMDMDEDDYGRLMQSGFRECPYFTDADEYKIVRHQL